MAMQTAHYSGDKGPPSLQLVENDSVSSKSRGDVDSLDIPAAAHNRSLDEGQQQLDGDSDPRLTNASTLESGLQRQPSEQWSVFSQSQKRFIVFMVAVAAFFSPLSANIYFPALNTLADQFRVSNGAINLTLTTYMIFQGLAPTVFGDFADIAGRRPAYILGFAIYIGACIGLARADSYAALLVLRMLQSTGSSGTIALASGVVADVATSAERGVWMGWATSGPMVAPAIAPVLGGIFAEFLGWRWIFWFLVILAGTFLVPLVITFPETGRNVVGNGSIPPQGWNQSLISYLQQRKIRRQTSAVDRARMERFEGQVQSQLRRKRNLRFPNPLNVLKVVMNKDVGVLLFFNSMLYVATYDVLAMLPNLLASTYGFDALYIGLCFLPLGFGSMLSPYAVGRLMDWNFRRIAGIVGLELQKGKAPDLRSFPLEKCRIQIISPLLALTCVTILCFGWVMQVETNLAAPLVLTFFIGFASTGAFNCMSVLLVDLYPLSPATATAANNLVRCLVGAAGIAVISYMIEAMGRGWCYTFIALVLAAFSPMLWVLQRWGPGWREARRRRLEQLNFEKTRLEQERQDEKK